MPLLANTAPIALSAGSGVVTLLVGAPRGARGAPASTSVATFLPGLIPTDGSSYLFIAFDGAAHLSGGVALALSAPSKAIVFPVYKISAGVQTQIGSIAFAAGSKTGVVNLTPTDFAQGDQFYIPSPNNPDTVMADVTFSFA